MIERPANIHAFRFTEGTTHYAVCVWDNFHSQYQAPLDTETRKLTGCYSEFSQTLQGIGGYTDRRKARRRARKLYGYSRNERANCE